MRHEISLFLICFGLTLFSYGQDTLNQFDSNGNKQGRWVVYLNDHWKELKDENGAKFCRYTWYEHGKNIYPMGAMSKKHRMEEVVHSNIYIGKARLLDGTYNWIDKNDRIMFALVLDNGEFVAYNEFTTTGELKQLFDYTDKWKDQPHSWSMRVLKKNGEMECYYMRLGKNGWAAYGCGLE